MISASRLREELEYIPATGEVKWIKGKPGRIKDKPIGAVSSSGYLVVRMDYKLYLLHRIIYQMHFGDLNDEFQVDHIDGNPMNNRIENLRKATPQQNAQNSKVQSDKKYSDLKGVTWHAHKSKWMARVHACGHSRLVGYFNTDKEAHAAYCRAASVAHSAFFNKGVSQNDFSV